MDMTFLENYNKLQCLEKAIEQFKDDCGYTGLRNRLDELVNKTIQQYNDINRIYHDFYVIGYYPMVGEKIQIIFKTTDYDGREEEDYVDIPVAYLDNNDWAAEALAEKKRKEEEKQKLKNETKKQQILKDMEKLKSDLEKLG